MPDTDKRAKDDPPNDPVAYQLFNEIGIINQLATAAFKEVLPPPLNTSMFGVLNNAVRLGDGKTPSQLANAFQVTRPSMTATLAKLERAGLVRIESGEGDGRTKRVWITKEGRAARDSALQATNALIEMIGPTLEMLDIERVVGDLAMIRETLDRARD